MHKWYQFAQLDPEEEAAEDLPLLQGARKEEALVAALGL
jgi:hypothetical protein